VSEENYYMGRAAKLGLALLWAISFNGKAPPAKGAMDVGLEIYAILSIHL
jgi:hypothetical protein